METSTAGPFHRRVPLSDEVDPARARWVAQVLSDPAAAKRERLEQRLTYWRARLAHHERRLAEIRAALAGKGRRRRAEALAWATEYGEALADAEHARAMVEQLERELARAAQA